MVRKRNLNSSLSLLVCLHNFYRKQRLVWKLVQ